MPRLKSYGLTTAVSARPFTVLTVGFWCRGLLLAALCSCWVLVAQGTPEAALETVAERYEVLPLSGGWALRPLNPAAEFRIIEVRQGMVAIDGEDRQAGELVRLLGEDAAPVLELAGLALPEVPPELGAGLPAESPESAEPSEPAADSSDSWREERRQRTSRRRSEARQSFGRPLHIGAEESVAEALVLGSYLEVDGEVRGRATVVGGSARIEGEIGDDLVVVGGSVELGPEAEIDGDVVSVGGTINRSLGSRVRGKISEVALGSVFSRPWNQGWERPRRHHRWRSNFSRWLMPAVQAGLIALVLLIVLQFARPTVEGVAQRTRSEPLKAGLTGLLAQVLFVPLMAVVSFVLAITIIGIPIMLALWLVVTVVVLVALLIGYTGVALNFGGFLERRFSMRGASLYLTLLLGVLLIHGWEVVGGALTAASGPLGWTAWLLVLVGGVVQYVAVTVGLGGVLLHRFDAAGSSSAVARSPELPPAWPPEEDGDDDDDEDDEDSAGEPLD